MIKYFEIFLDSREGLGSISFFMMVYGAGGRPIPPDPGEPVPSVPPVGVADKVPPPLRVQTGYLGNKRSETWVTLLLEYMTKFTREVQGGLRPPIVMITCFEMLTKASKCLYNSPAVC